MRTMLRSLLAAVALSVAAASAVAAYPDRPVILVNPYAAGGPADVVARSLARALPDARARVVDGQRHMLPVEAPAVVASALHAFLLQNNAESPA